MATLLSGVYLPSLEQALRRKVWPVGRVPTDMAHFLIPQEDALLPLRMAYLEPGLDWDAVGARMREEVLLALDRIDEVGIVTPDRLVATTAEHWPTDVIAAHLAIGDRDGAITALHELAEEVAARGDDPRTDLFVALQAERCDVDPSTLRGPGSTRPRSEDVAIAIQEALGPTVLAIDGHGGRAITLVLLQPTDAEVDLVRELVGPLALFLDSVPLRPDEVESLRPALARVLAERERARGDLTAWVHDASGQISWRLIVGVANLDRATLRAIHAVVPPPCVSIHSAARGSYVNEFRARADRIAALGSD